MKRTFFGAHQKRTLWNKLNLGSVYKHKQKHNNFIYLLPSLLIGYHGLEHYNSEARSFLKKHHEYVSFNIKVLIMKQSALPRIMREEIIWSITNKFKKFFHKFPRQCGFQTKNNTWNKVTV